MGETRGFGSRYLDDRGWCLAIVNGRLAEIYFDEAGKKMKLRGHCYVLRKEYTTNQEQRWIDRDTKRYTFTYRNKKYARKDINAKTVQDKTT
ncbi:hypothetical protein HY504_00930 [Candidatus Wolfebacteria bacterium]|nr:hypothetical protein [Candidatus Wolfebacteria bacterium]